MGETVLDISKSATTNANVVNQEDTLTLFLIIYQDNSDVLELAQFRDVTKSAQIRTDFLK